MGGLGGWFWTRPRESEGLQDPSALGAIVGRFAAGAPATVIGTRAAIVAAGHAGEVDTYRGQDLIAAVWGSVRFADRHLTERAAAEGVAAAVAHGYQRHGTASFESLSGEFALAVCSEASGQAVIVADRMGIRPLYYRELDDGLVFGTHLGVIRQICGDLEISAQAIYDYVHFHSVPAPGTIYSGCRRLLPGQLLVSRPRAAEVRQYWSMQYIESERRPFDVLKQEFLSVLRSGVRNAIPQGSAVGAFLSGGTDSSTLAGILGEVQAEPARTYSIGFDAAGFDEIHYARIAARHFGTRHKEYYVTPSDVVNAIPDIALVHDQPFGNSSAIPAYYCARLAREDGVQVLLGGDGGDELFGGNSRYAKQYIYSLYSDLPKALRTQLIEPIARAVPFEGGVVGKIQRYIRNASVPMPARYDDYNLLERMGRENVFEPDFLASVDPRAPARQMAELYASANARTLINRMLAIDLKYTLADSDLPKVTRSCELAGVAVRFPLLDDAVVAFSARLAPSLKLKRTRLRYFFKEALRGFLPDEIITKTKHGFGLPIGRWMQSHAPLRELVTDSLNSLCKRSFIRPDFVRDLMSVRMAEHCDYYGTMAWILMMLELWYQRHSSPCESAG